MKRLLVLALLGVLIAPAPAEAWKSGEKTAMQRCSQHRPLSCIQRAALHHRVSYPMLKWRAWCESRWNPWAANSAHAGLFQFRVARPSTWATVPRRYAQHSPYSAKWASLAAAWMQRVGRGGEWACA
jgi:hypothetical protein